MADGAARDGLIDLVMNGIDGWVADAALEPNKLFNRHDQADAERQRQRAIQALNAAKLAPERVPLLQVASVLTNLSERDILSGILRRTGQPQQVEEPIQQELFLPPPPYIPTRPARPAA